MVQTLLTTKKVLLKEYSDHFEVLNYDDFNIKTLRPCSHPKTGLLPDRSEVYTRDYWERVVFMYYGVECEWVN